MKKYFCLICILFLGAVVFSSCRHDTTLQPDAVETVYFDTQVLPVFQNTCALSGCHNSASRKEGYDLSTYASITSHGIEPGNANKSAIYRAITGQGELMPPGNPLPIEQRNLIRIWIDQGAENTTDPDMGSNPGTTQPPDTTVQGAEFCFSRDVHPILVSNCATSGCHDAATHEEGYNFTTYESTLNKGVTAGSASQSQIYKVITTNQGEDDFMPPAPRAPLASDEISAIARWINEGALNEECAEQCDPQAIDFTANIAPIIATYCEGCHQNGAANGNVILETEAQILAIANDGRLLNTLNATNGYPKMPPSIDLTSCEVEQITNWVNSLN